MTTEQKKNAESVSNIAMRKFASHFTFKLFKEPASKYKHTIKSLVPR